MEHILLTGEDVFSIKAPIGDNKKIRWRKSGFCIVLEFYEKEKGQEGKWIEVPFFQDKVSEQISDPAM